MSPSPQSNPWKTAADGVSIGNVLKIFEGLDLLEQAESLLDPQRDPQAVIYATRKIGVC